jgi:hypothetical protein
VRILAVICALLALVAAWGTYALLALALIPQDSGVSATGDWEYALVPGAATVALALYAIALWRKGA